VLSPVQSTRFKRDVKRMEKRGKNMLKLRDVVKILISEAQIPIEYGDHALKGVWKHFRDLHIEPDWLLIYRIDSKELYLAGTGTHSDLFNE
jgi:mRNA interferase YafQ